MPPRPRPHRPQRRDKARDATGAPVETIYGLRAGLAVFERRRDAIERVAYARAVQREVTHLVRWAHATGVLCKDAPEHELERLAQSPQHEGLVVVAGPRPYATPPELVDALAHTRGAALALDRVRNPYNVGAALRSAAFFGLDAVLLGAPAPHPGLAPNAVRVAEGGAEHVLVARTTDLADTLARLRAQGVLVVGTDGRADKSALGFRFTWPAIVVMGNEREGLGDRVRAQCDALVAIPGTGAVESLNVGVAAGILISEMVRSRA